jgi:hypothetical protein
MISAKIPFRPTKDIRLDLKKCVNCKHFRPYKTEGVVRKEDIHHNATCKLFGLVDMVTGDETFLACKVARCEDAYCGNNAVFFVPNENLAQNDAMSHISEGLFNMD